jgi:hypothetical protein
MLTALLSQRKTPAKPARYGTTAELKTLLDVGIASRGIIGFALYLQTGDWHPAGFGCHGMSCSGAPISLLNENASSLSLSFVKCPFPARPADCPGHGMIESALFSD